MRLLGALLVAALVAAAVWTFFPGVRPHVEQAYERYGGWTEAARANDPVGYIEYAEQRLADDLAAFAESQASLERAREDAERRLGETRARIAAADALAERFRDAFRAGRFPVTVAGAAYGREALVEQVAVILNERRAYTDVEREFERAIVAIAERRRALIDRAGETRAVLGTLGIEKALARAGERGAANRSLMDDLDRVIDGNAAVGSAGGAPVRPVQELLTAAPERSSGGVEAALDFLGADR